LKQHDLPAAAELIFPLSLCAERGMAIVGAIVKNSLFIPHNNIIFITGAKTSL
jgi:hypothetical protein